MREHKNELEAAIEEALRSYRAPEREGLEARVASGVHRRVRRRRVWAGSLWSAAVTVLLVCILLVRPNPEAQPAPNIASASAIALPVEPAPRREFGVLRVRRQREEPRRAQFPTPSPMTAEERALVRFVTSHPQEAAQILEEINGPVREIQIAAIEIKPIEIKEN